ncbi:putative dynamin [Glonium stellatum]|uniref:Putative dynamin n=1 Tax=Glonium stellatum TaxID=574774 RepID=A0A8E2JNH7_9PEZI|nr:putative dynamin [Glonium stellatum]
MADPLAPKLGHLASAALLRKIDELREKSVGQHVPLPQLVVVGDQSSGKSSLLESLTTIPFPRNVELCTRYATQITSRRDSESRVDITIIPGPRAPEEHKKHLAAYHPTILSTDNFRDKFPQILNEANFRMGIRTDTSSGVGTVFSEDILKIELCGPDQDYLTVIDVPGIFRNPTEGITTKNDIQLVQNMVKEYIKNDRTIILAVLPSNVDIATQEILTLAEDYDKAGERTLGVLTKPDLVTEQSAQAAVCNLVLGKRRPLTLGYYVVRSRGADDDNFSNTDAEKMFQDAPWNKLPSSRLGVLALKARLTELLSEITRKEFPKLRKEVSKQLSDCQTELEALGAARETERDQRLFLSALARHFQALVDAALSAHYSSDAIFEEMLGLRLITCVVNLTEMFNYNFQQKGHYRSFEDPGTDSTMEVVRVRTVAHRADTHAKEGTSFFADIDLDEFTDLGEVVSRDCHIDDPQGGILDWTEQLYLRSRGTDLGTFSGAILSSAFKEQSSKWAPMTKAYISQIIVVIHRFMVIILERLCPDPHVREEIWSSIHDEVLKRYKVAMDQAMFLVSLERDKRPYTVNHYFNDNLQIARGHRMANMLKPNSRPEIKQDSRGLDYCSTNLIVDLDHVRQTTRSKGNVEQVKEEIHDILWSYYKVAQKRFIDNVYQQAVDHCLLTGPMSPLAVFTQEWVIVLEADQLEIIVGESGITKERRAALKRKIKDLETAVQILRH